MSQDVVRAVVQRPFQLGRVQVSSRVFLPAHSYGFASDAIGVERYTAYVRRRLAAGVGLVIVGEAEVPFLPPSRAGQPGARIAGQASRCLYESLAAVAESNEGLVFEQLFHPGGQVWFEEGRPAFAPSRVPQERSYVLPTAMTASDIRMVQRSFVESAQAAFAGGLKGIEIKADQGKLHHQFLSARFNHRHDEYGGSLIGRVRFLSETLDAIRQAIPELPVLGLRLSGEVTVPPPGMGHGVFGADLSIAETQEIIALLEEKHLFDYVSISGETNSSVHGYWRNHGNEAVSEQTFRYVAERIREGYSGPLLLSGRIRSLAQAAELLESGACDLVGMARALVADAELMQKPAVIGPASSTEPVRPCISCNLGCVGNTWFGGEIRCIYDPLSGREAQFEYVVQRRLRFAVVGAGPAGLEFSRMAARLGSPVALYERASEVGGQLRHWALLPHRRLVANAIEYWSQCMSHPLITLRLNTPAPPEGELLSQFDYVIRAIGGQQIIPDHEYAATEVRSMTVDQMFSSKTPWDGRQAIVVEANRYGDPLGVALYLLEQGAHVTVVCPFSETGLGLDPVSRASRLTLLHQAGARIFEWADVRPGAGRLAVIWNHAENTNISLDGVTDIIWCVNPLPADASPAGNGDTRVLAIGDARLPRGLESITKEAHDLAFSLLCGQSFESPRV